MSSQRVTVFGGTGFLGRHIVRHLLDADLAVRIASRHPDRAHSLFSHDVSRIESIYTNVSDDGSVAAGVAGAWAVVNAVSLYVERGKYTFHSVHVDAAKRIATLARQAGSETLVHMSGIGADAGSASPYIRSRGEGEAAVLDAFPSAKLVRPAVMFGPGDAFLTPLLAMLRRMPVFPMFGSGATRLQPAYVEDVAEAIARILRAPAASQLHELAGPRVYTYQELLRAIAASAGTSPLLVPLPFSLWHVIGYVSEVLPNPPITRNQVELMEQDNVPERSAPGFEALQISPRALENMLSEYVTAGEGEAKA
jgi:NADH dehydrogenase